MEHKETMIEEWRDIKGYEGKYQVSNMGRVRSLDRDVWTVKNGTRCIQHMKGRVLSPAKSYKGREYLHLTLVGFDGKHRSYKVHRLVAMAFVPGYAEDKEVNHIDENPANNRADNLEWVSHRVNLNYGSHNFNIGISRSKPVLMFNQSGDLVAKFCNIHWASRITGIARASISACCNHDKGICNAGDYKWEWDS